jgi:DNA-binding response OmpR family regulator
MRILLIDDTAYREATASTLRREGFDVRVAPHGPEGFRRWQAEGPAAVLVDATTGPAEGVELCRRIREHSETPLLIVGAGLAEGEVLGAFAAGADDVVPWPFGPRELAWRIRAVERRLRSRDRRARPDFVVVRGVRLDRQACQVAVDERRVQLTALEFRLFDVLAANAGRVVTYGRLIEVAWNYDGGTPSSLRNHIGALRRKLSALPGGPLRIDATPGVGYSLRIARSIERSPEPGSLAPNPSPGS